MRARGCVCVEGGHFHFNGHMFLKNVLAYKENREKDVRSDLCSASQQNLFSSSSEHSGRQNYVFLSERSRVPHTLNFVTF